MRGIFGAIAAAVERKAVNIEPKLWEAITSAGGVKSGVPVSISTALKVSTVLSACRVLAEGLAQVPLKLYRETEKGAEAAKDHPVYKLLYRRPNDWQTSFEFREGMMFHAVLAGAGHAYIGRIDDKIRELIPLASGSVTPRMSDDYELVYEIRDRHGVVAVVPRRDIFTVRGPSWDNKTALDLVQQAREAIGLAIATEETHARLHGNGARPGGLLSVKSGLGKVAKQRLKEQWQESAAGVKNSFGTVVLDGDVEYKPMAFNGVDNQHLDTRRFQIEEICRALRVFPQMVGYADKTATFASAEAFFLAHVIHSLQPWVERWEQCIARDLLDGAGDIDLFAKFSLQGLLRGDAKTRAEFYTSAIGNGWMTRNEVRRLEELNELPGLDDPLVPLNMGTQAERDAAAKEITETVKSMLGHNGGPDLNADELEFKIGRVLSAKNEKRIVTARDELSAVLTSLPQPDA